MQEQSAGSGRYEQAGALVGLRCALSMAAISAAVLTTTSVHAQLRVVNYNIAGVIGNQAALQSVLAAIHADDKPGFAVPISVIVFQETKSTNVATLQSLLNASAPPGVSYSLGTYTSSVVEDNSAGAQCLFYRTGMLQEFVASHADIPTGANRNADRWRLQMVSYGSINAWFYIYSSHLKADTGTTNEQLRLNGVTAIRANADPLGANQHIIYCGDQNFYNNNEPGYLMYLTVGNGRAFDPFGTGSWAGGSGSPNNIKHSQSPRQISAGGLVGGGLNDRFDFQLTTAAFDDGQGLSRIANTYRSLGNDGLHYNVAINSGNNSYYLGNIVRSNALANNLHDASDHVPVIVDYQIPAMMAGSMPAVFGRVIQNANFSVDVTVTNPANVATPVGADVLQYAATGSVSLSGVFSSSVAALSAGNVHHFPLNTSTVGPALGTVTLSSSNQAVQPTQVMLNTAGNIVRPSNASFSSASDVNQITVPVQFSANSGVQNIVVPVYNYGFDSSQALLDIDSVSAVVSPFSYSGGAMLGIGASPATLQFSFNTNGAPGGLYSAPVAINVSDENIPGAVNSALGLTTAVTIISSAPCPADVNGDHYVNVDDLLTVINNWGACPRPCPQSGGCAADVNGNCFVNVDDLLVIINGWGVCP